MTNDSLIQLWNFENYVSTEYTYSVAPIVGTRFELYIEVNPTVYTLYSVNRI